MNIKLVAIDMDGTLLNDRGEVSSETIEALKAAQRKNVEIVISTGRVLKSALYFGEKLGLKSHTIASNGAIITDRDLRIIYNSPLDKQTIKTVVEIAKEENIYFHFYNENTYFSNKYIKEIDKYYNSSKERLKGQNINFELFDDVDEIINQKDINIYKFLFIDDDLDKLNKVRDRLRKIEGVNISKSGINNIELTRRDVSKGQALQYVSSLLGIEKSEIMSIGDNDNDLSMLERAGISVAMGNAEKEIKEIADFVTKTNNEDGVAYAFRKFILE
ncbi:MAG TPA: Cof-type HAD-IIB family hydrolase [Soehngenia sp.]|nr:Cof-type HAD-IIB family hydrolase [Soehngenia sp.]